MNLYLWSTFSSRSCEPFMNNDVTIDLFVIKPICSLVLQYIRLLFVYIQLNKNALKRHVVPLFLQPKYSLTLTTTERLWDCTGNFSRDFSLPLASSFLPTPRHLPDLVWSVEQRICVSEHQTCFWWIDPSRSERCSLVVMYLL